MADLGSFDRPILNDKYVDVLDTIRENIKRSKAAADAAQQTANDALAAAGSVDAALGNYMPKSGGRFTGQIATPGIVSEVGVALTGLGDGEGTIISAGPWGENRGAGLVLHGVSASDTGWGVNSAWELRSPGNPSLVGREGLYWGDHDLGRWAPIDPASKANASELDRFYEKTGGWIRGRVMVSGRDSVAANAVLDVVAPADSPNNQRVFLAGWMGVTNGFTVAGNGRDGSILYSFSDAPGGAHLYFKGNDLGRWAAIDPDSLVPKSGGVLTGSLSTSQPWDGFAVGEGTPYRGGLAYYDERGIYLWNSADDTLILDQNTRRLLWNHADLGRWAAIDPGSKADKGIMTFTGDPVYPALVTNVAGGPSNFWNAGPNDAFGVTNRGWTGHLFSVGWDGAARAHSFQSWSDARKKRDLASLNSALDKLRALTGYTYNWIDSGKPAAGLIAQDVEPILPMAVSEHDGVKSLDYNAVVALLVNAVKELNAKVEGALQHG